MFVSIVITYYDPQQRKVDMLCDLVRSIGENSFGKNYKLEIVLNGKSYVDSINEGLRRSTGDYIIILNDDVLIEDPEWIDKLCKPDCISAWQLGEFHLTKDKVPDAACFAMSKEVQKRIGFMDERFRDGINFEDTDYFFRAKELGIPFLDAGVKLKHYGNITLDKYFLDEKWGKTYRNESIFYQKWHESIPRRDV